MRLVARTLERDWEAALAAEQALEAEHARDLARQPVRLQAAELEAIRRLAEDVPALWHAPTTTAGDRQAIARLVLDHVAVQADGERVEVACHWAGGVQTRHATTRPVRRFEQLHGFDQVLALIRDLRRQGCSAAAVAEQLNAAGWRPPKRERFDAAMVQRLVFRHSLGSGRRCCMDPSGGAGTWSRVGGSLLTSDIDLAFQAEPAPPSPHPQAEAQGHELARV